MTAVDGAGRSDTPVRRAGLLARWLKRHRARRRRIAHAVWDLRERYGAAAHAIAQSSARQPVGAGERRFWRKVARRLQQLG